MDQNKISAYIAKIELENVGPIDKIGIELPFYTDGNPKPLLIVGKNGTGKSILISHIVNALTQTKNFLYPDEEIEKEKVYKLRHPHYIKTGQKYYYSKIIFQPNNLIFEEVQIESKEIKSEIPKEISDKIPEHQTSYISRLPFSNVENIKKIIDKNCILYFPPNRFEDPAWLNNDNLLNKPDFRDLKHMIGSSNRSIIQYAPLKDNQKWLLDLIFDAHVYIQTTKENVIISETKEHAEWEVIRGHDNPTAKNINKSVISFLNILFQTKENLSFGYGERRQRRIVIKTNGELFIPNLFNLSTGQTALLNIFLTIIKDFDLTNQPFTTLEDITGIVVIDEIDLHLHANYQSIVLPQLIKLFPKVQFIITTHSPLFLLGLEKELGESNFRIFDVGEQKQITIDEFEEFRAIFELYHNTNILQDLINKKIDTAKALQIITEGNNIEHIEKAISILDHRLSNKIHFVKDVVDKTGKNQLKTAFEVMSNSKNNKFLFIWDCDAASEVTKLKETEFFYIHCFEKTDDDYSKAKKGIENLYKVDLFTKDVYKSKTTCDDYGGTKQISDFLKKEFLEKIKEINDPDTFKNYAPLIEKIKNILNLSPLANPTSSKP